MSPPPPKPVLSPAAAIMAWLWPGLGHLSLGERKRGFLLMFGVLFLFLTGLLIGGVDSVDKKNDRLWFFAQSLCGPITLAADFANQKFVQRFEDDWRRDHELRSRFLDGDEALLDSLRRVGLGRVNEMGTLFIALAGLMNLVVILDALWCRTAVPTRHQARTAARSTPAPEGKTSS